ncbi:MAG: hypothetical protein G01um101413_646 [Parcubacteria group bacterium Gr01-1014_13]|nr:MAG: hypothetical protein G01um101413_646 [Parcubacteria group bacterium Gr01-1014_13]
MENHTPTHKGRVIKSLYFYLVSFVALMMVVFSAADLINIALRTWVFTAADKDMYAYPRAVCEVPPTTDPKAVPAPTKAECEKSNEENIKQQEASRLAQKQRDVVRDISMIVVGIPLFLIHWRILRSKEENL